MSPEATRETLRAYILKNFLPGEPPETLKDSTLLITSGVIGSLSLVELVTFIEDTFGITLEQEDIGTARMDSVDLMAKLIAERAGSAGRVAS